MSPSQEKEEGHGEEEVEKVEGGSGFHSDLNTSLHWFQSCKKVSQ